MTSLEKWQSPDAIRTWWEQDHQKQIKRPWSAELVSTLRQPLPMVPVANPVAMKLRRVLQRSFETKTGTLTFGVTDSAAAHMMAEAKYECLYVSGALCSIADVPGTFDVGEDLADYPWDTVPRKVAQLFNSQLMWSRVDQTRRQNGAVKKEVDHLVPIIADADSGHGATTATMKLTKAFVDAGVSGIHIDDLYSGVKKFGTHGLDHVVVPSSEHIRRLLAARLQLDVMGSEALLIHRTDAEFSNRITSTIDPVDRPFIHGCTVPDLDTFLEAKAKGVTEDDWHKAATLSTIDEAVQACTTPEDYSTFLTATHGLNSSSALAHALRKGYPVVWDAECGRTSEGWYCYKTTIDAAIARAVAAAPYVDLVWSCTPAYDEERARRFAEGVHAVFPSKQLAYNWTGPFQKHNPADEDIKGLADHLGAMGYVWQFSPLAGQFGSTVGFHKYVNGFKRDGLLAYVEEVLRGGSEADFLGWVGHTGQMADAMTNAVEL